MLESTPYFVSWGTLLLVGWGTLSLINAGLAQSKNRSGLGWGLLSVFLGPIATFLVVVLPPNDTGGSAWAKHRIGVRVTRARQRSADTGKS